MKNFLRFTLIIGSLLCWGCSGDTEKEEEKPLETSTSFLQSYLELSASPGEVTVTVNWSATLWEIVMDTNTGMINQISPSQGGEAKTVNQRTNVKISYTENTGLEARTQDVFLVNKTTGTRTKLTIEQSSQYKSLAITLDPSTKYQHVVGFGGMYNPKIWLAANNLITTSDINKMYGPDGLGYNILRLMVYPNENDWAADVEGAKLAQQHGAIIFACPWDCTDALADKITVNSKEYKHLKVENYQAYANHLVKYINYMKAQGVNLYAISVQNEPDMDFTFWHPAEVVNFVKAHGAQIRATGVKLMSPEACGMSPEYTDPILNDATAFGQTDILAGHLYQGFIGTASTYEKNRHDYIAGLYTSKLAPASKTWWMTEHLFNDTEKETNPSAWIFQQWAYTMEHLAKELHMSMDGYCSAYIYWYLKRFYGMIADSDNRSQATVGTTLNNGYILSHYAKYASNTTRIKVSSGDSDVMATAYVNAAGTEMTVVLLNMKSAYFYAKITSPTDIKSITAVESTDAYKMKDATTTVSEDKKMGTVLMAPKSIVSIRVKL